MSKLGIIQSRGLGDILIALPIAKYYADNFNDEVYWPICEEFWPSLKDSAPWVHWIPVPADNSGDFFYTEPMKRLKNFKVDEIICLYQSLNVVPELAQVPWFQFQKFDEFKYTKAGVPFIKKWTLDECINLDPPRMTAFHAKMVKQPDYYVTHVTGSTFSVSPDLSGMPPEWQRIDINPATQTDNIWDWYHILSGAKAVVLIDSVFSNMVDLMPNSFTDVDKYFIPRSHIHLTPVLGSTWTILDAPPGSGAAQVIFTSNPPPPPPLKLWQPLTPNPSLVPANMNTRDAIPRQPGMVIPNKLG